jgi:hypothetical protein
MRPRNPDLDTYSFMMNTNIRNSDFSAPHQKSFLAGCPRRRRGGNRPQVEDRMQPEISHSQVSIFLKSSLEKKFPLMEIILAKHYAMAAWSQC